MAVSIGIIGTGWVGASVAISVLNDGHRCGGVLRKARASV
jgi:3-hydroxyisobutyrate dehydrogenase-like beta-hydroxyacid dehydrogenase